MSLTRTEVALAVHAATLLEKDEISARVVSLPSWEDFRALERVRQVEILPPDLPILAVEAGAGKGWLEFADSVVGHDRFGASTPPDVAHRELGLTPEAVAAGVISVLERGAR